MITARFTGLVVLLVALSVATVGYGCGPDRAAAPAGMPESVSGVSSSYHVSREGEVVNDQRKIVFVRDPKLGELTVVVSESVPTAEAAELVNFLLINNGATYSSQIQAISNLGPLRWSVTVGEKALLCPSGRYRATIVRNHNGLTIERVQWISNT